MRKFVCTDDDWERAEFYYRQKEEVRRACNNSAEIYDAFAGDQRAEDEQRIKGWIVSNLDKWIEAVLCVADSNGMDDSQEIDTWPSDAKEHYPVLTVGDVREWQASRQELDGQEMTLIKTLVDIRFACGDDGKRMQGELVEYIAELSRKAKAGNEQDGRSPTEVWLGNGDKLIADIYADDGYSYAGIGIFEPEQGRTGAIGEPDGQYDGRPLDKTNAIVLIRSTRPESLQVMIDELTEAMARLGSAPTKTDEPCEWKQNDDGGWDGSCGIEFYLEEDTPPENGIKFCPECGKPCVAIEPTEEQDDE